MCRFLAFFFLVLSRRRGREGGREGGTDVIFRARFSDPLVAGRDSSPSGGISLDRGEKGRGDHARQETSNQNPKTYETKKIIKRRKKKKG